MEIPNGLHPNQRAVHLVHVMSYCERHATSPLVFLPEMSALSLLMRRQTYLDYKIFGRTTGLDFLSNSVI